MEQAATESRRPKAWIINEALAAYFEREYQDQRMYCETLEGLADVEAGRVIDDDQVVAWIESWGSDKEMPPLRPWKLRFTPKDLEALHEFLTEKNLIIVQICHGREDQARLMASAKCTERGPFQCA